MTRAGANVHCPAAAAAGSRGADRVKMGALVRRLRRSRAIKLV
jgi:hypothetical protein